MARTFALLAAMTSLVAVAPATASTATWSDKTLTVTGAPGADDLVVGSNGFVYDENGITAGAGCAQDSPTAVQCGPTDPEYGFTIAGDFDVVEIVLGDGDDKAGVTNSLVRRIAIDGGAGNDDISATSADDVELRGGDGNDTVRGYTSDDRLFGGAGNDTLTGGDGSDEIDAGTGQDTVQGDGGVGGSNGNDRILVRDGQRDTVGCDLGADVVVADAADVVESATCESVSRAPSARKKALARCRALPAKTKAQKRKRATCMRKARRHPA